MSERYIFVDVDGVLNPLGLLPEDGFLHSIALDGLVYGVNLSKTHARLLLDLAEKTGAVLVWATMWNDYANEYISPAIGLPVLPVAQVKQEKFSETVAMMKARTVLSYAGDSSFVDFDDEFYIGPLLEGTNGIHIFVDPYAGLKEQHITKAENFFSTAKLREEQSQLGKADTINL